MDIEDRKRKLLFLIDEYQNSKIDVVKLYDYCANTIEFFTKNKSVLPPYEENKEKAFWYAIWQLQHLADTEHENDGSLQRALLEIMNYLKFQENLPDHFEGKRPC